VQVSKACAEAVECLCQARARQAKLRLAQRPRGVHGAVAYPYLRLLRSRACVACANTGEFHLRASSGSRLNASHGLLCVRCSKKKHVQEHLVRQGAYVDLVGITGKRLIRKVVNTARPKHRPPQPPA